MSSLSQQELNNRQLEQVICWDYETIFSMKHKKEEENEKSSGGYVCYGSNGVHGILLSFILFEDDSFELKWK